MSGDKTFTGDVIFESNIHMAGGNVFVANTINMTVFDPIMELGSNNHNTGDLGIIMTRHIGTNSNVAIVYDEGDDILRMGYTLNGASDSIVDLDSSNALAVSVQGALTAASISGPLSGNASTATALQTARNIGGVSFDGTANIDLPGVNAAGTQNTSGNADTATALQTARNIGGVSFDGTANIDLPGVNTPGNQNTVGNADTATALQTARNIGGVSFDGTADIDLPGVNTPGTQNTSGNADTATTATNQSGGTVNATTGHFSGDVTLESNLRVNGSLTYANTVNMIVSDPIMELGANNLHTNDLGLVFTRHGNSGNDSNVAIFYDESEDTLKIGYTDDNATQTTLSTTATGLDVSITGNVAAAYDTDTTSYFGRVAMGFTPGNTNQASFAHIDKNNSNDYALKQAASGVTYINAGNSKHIRFCIQDNEKARFTGSGDFKVGANKLLVEPANSTVSMYSQDTGSTAGPDLLLMRNNPNNGSNGDYIGQVRYEGLSDSGTSRLYAKTTGKIKTATNGSESGIIETALRTGGSQMISVRHSGDLFHIKNDTDFQVGETANLYVDTSTSRVGIGLSNPSYTLDVSGDINFTGSLLQNGGAFQGSKWTTTGSAVYRPSGNVGIGVAPSYKLDVSGDINFTGSLLQNGSAFQGSSWTTSGSDVYRSSGGVGIGTTSPGDTLHVYKNGYTPRVSIETPGAHDAELYLKNSNGYWRFRCEDTTADLKFINGNGVHTTFRDNGFVGIGTQTPGSLLAFYKDYAVPSNGSEPAGDQSQGITFMSDISSYTGTGEPLWTNSASPVSVARIWFQPTSYQGMGGYAPAGVHGTLSFGTGYAGAQSTVPDMVINTEGKVGIGTTRPGAPFHVIGNQYIYGPEAGYGGTGQLYIAENTTFGGELRLGVNRAYVFMDSTQNAPLVLNSNYGSYVGINERTPTERLHVNGNILASGNITAYSDKRIKSDITKIENALDKIEKLNGYTYTVKDERYTGLIAQEVLPVLPEAVTGSEETQYGLAYGNMMGLVVEAIKEMREEIKSIRSRL
jgi:hypothetical protein